jgi:hypothetical protein
MKQHIALFATLFAVACAPMPTNNDSGVRADTGVTPGDSGVTPTEDSGPSGEVNVVGTWVGTAPNMRAEGMMSQVRLAFVGSAESGMVTMSITFTFAEGDALSGCNSVVRLMGSYSVVGARVSLTFASGTAAASNCDNAANNAPDTALNSMQLQANNVSGDAVMSASNRLQLGLLNLMRE